MHTVALNLGYSNKQSLFGFLTLDLCESTPGDMPISNTNETKAWNAAKEPHIIGHECLLLFFFCVFPFDYQSRPSQ